MSNVILKLLLAIRNHIQPEFIWYYNWIHRRRAWLKALWSLAHRAYRSTAGPFGASQNIWITYFLKSLNNL